MAIPPAWSLTEFGMDVSWLGDFSDSLLCLIGLVEHFLVITREQHGQLIVTLFGARMVRLVGQEVAPRDQFVTAHLGIPSDAERILAKGLGQVKKIITYVG